MTDDTRRIAISVFAGEVALGTLSPEEEATVINRLGGDPDFLAERDAWERRLAPLASIVPRVAPSQGLWARIAAETVNSDSEPFGVLPTLLRDEAPVIDLEQAVAQRTRHLRARLRRWRVAATALTALAAGLAFFAVLAPRLTETPVPASSTASQRYVAVVTPSGDAPPLLVAVDLARGELSVQPVDLKPAAGKALELWAVPTGAKPVSLGLVTAADRRSIGSLQPSTWRDPGLLIAVSEEPAGGSPTGQPTGPVVYKGRLVRSP